VEHLVIIGNSAAGLAAVEAIRSRDRRSRVTVIAAERHPPYSRIMLTYLLAGKTTHERMLLHEPDWYREMDIEALTGQRAVAIDTQRRQVITEDSSTGGGTKRVSFDRLLIATGASAQRPDVPGMDLPGVFCLRDLDDANAILKYVDEQLPTRRVPKAVFLGGGPVCLQALTALSARGMKVSLVVRSKAIFSQLADPDTASLAEKVLRAHDIGVRKGVEVCGIESRAGSRRSAGRLLVQTRQGKPLPADLVIIGKGTQPNLEVARGTDIPTDVGIVVDETMETSVPGVFAAGDAAQATHCVTGRKVCYGTWTNACEQGRIAGLNMVGSQLRWTGGLNRNVTTLFDNTLGSVGVIRADAAANDRRPGVTLKRYSDSRRRVSRRVLFSRGRCLGAVVWNACDDLGVLSWLISTGRDCTGWEERVARGENVCGDVLGLKQARGPLSLVRMDKTA
jgi:nitrite reductase (NADH) large subunit